MGDKIQYWILVIVVIFFLSIIITLKLGLASGYKDGFDYGYEHNPLKNCGLQTVNDIKSLINNLALENENQLIGSQIIKQLSNFEKELTYYEKKRNDEEKNL